MAALVGIVGVEALAGIPEMETLREHQQIVHIVGAIPCGCPNQ
jgi:hypothetical protein